MTEGTITTVLVAVGWTSKEIVRNYATGDSFFSVLGPVGMPVEPAELPGVFVAVGGGFDADLAVAESFRCIECKDAPCVRGCPVNIDIPAFIKCVREGKFDEAYGTIIRDNLFPAICGRVCPQEEQCEAACTIGQKVPPVAIGRLERFVADYVSRRNTSVPLTPGALRGSHGPAGQPGSQNWQRHVAIAYPRSG